MKYTVKILLLVFVISLISKNSLFAQKNPQPNPNIALCNNLDSIITVEQIQGLIKDSCLSILSIQGQSMEGEILSFQIIYASFKASDGQWTEFVTGNKLTSTILERLKKAKLKDVIIITNIKLQTNKRIQLQYGRMYEVRQLL